MDVIGGEHTQRNDIITTIQRDPGGEGRGQKCIFLSGVVQNDVETYIYIYIIYIYIQGRRGGKVPSL